MKHTREIWVDDVKVIACILVVIGHFFKSMVESEILSDNGFLQWSVQTIYFFHVPLFFICSGYLYQKYSRVNTVKSWKNNVLKKAVVLGIPYITFSFVTWILKTVFSGSVNTEIGGLFEILFVVPTGAYWYLHALLLIFIITPTFSSANMAFAGMITALAGKFISIMCEIEIYAVSAVLLNEIWFAAGMCLVFLKRKALKIQVYYAIGLLFCILSVMVYLMKIQNQFVFFALGIMACAAVIGIVYRLDLDNEQNSVFSFLSKYTMPIFLMHTLFAAAFRSVLLELGVSNALIHAAGGITVSFLGPIKAAEIMKRTKTLEFFIYPGKFIKFKQDKTA